MQRCSLHAGKLAALPVVERESSFLLASVELLRLWVSPLVPLHWNLANLTPFCMYHKSISLFQLFWGLQARVHFLSKQLDHHDDFIFFNLISFQTSFVFALFLSFKCSNQICILTILNENKMVIFRLILYSS